LRDGDRGRYQRIARTVKQVAPFFRDFVLEPELAPDRVRLRWQQEGSDTVLPADALSDGTLRFICLAALLSGPGRKSFGGRRLGCSCAVGDHWSALVTWRSQTRSKISSVLPLNQIWSS
jgi:hypothetical protein